MKLVTIKFQTNDPYYFDASYIMEVLQDCEFGLGLEEIVTLKVKIEEIKK